MPKTVLKSVDEYMDRMLGKTDSKMEEVVPIGKTKQIEVRAGEEDEPSIVVSIVEEGSVEE